MRATLKDKSVHEYLDFCEDPDPDKATRKAVAMEEKWRRIIANAGGSDFVNVYSVTNKAAKGVYSYRLKLELVGDRSSPEFIAFTRRLGWQ
jgi:hypothetical protein